jgi:hypothetical protein
MRPPFAAGARLRFIVLGASIASDWNNPVATSARAVLSAIAATGHDVTYLEQRGNTALAGLLAMRGSRPFKAFTDRYPEIQYRTYDLPRGWERTVWFGREIGTADVVIAFPGTPEPLLPEIAALPSPHLLRLVDESLATEHADFTLVRAGGDASVNRLSFGPAVSLNVSTALVRTERPLLVAYDDAAEAESARERLAGHDPELIQSGSVDLPGWTYVPEVGLPEWYATRRVAIVTGTGSSPWSEARRLLPLASGCLAIDRAQAFEPNSYAGTVELGLPPAFDAATQAHAILKTLRERLGRTAYTRATT